MRSRPYALRLVTPLLMLMVCAASCLVAQLEKPAVPLDVAVGTWQGTLGPDASTRIVLTISSANGSLRGVFWWIDRDANAVSFSSLTLRQQHLVADSDLLDVHYGATLAGDGQSMTGTWSQGKQQSALQLTRVSADTAWRHKDAVPTPMATTANPAFEVATVKPSQDQHKGKRYEWRTRQFRANNVTVADLLQYAFGLRERQIKKAPEWTSMEKFDIAAEPDAPGLPNEQQYHIMMRKLLAERFGLRFQMREETFPVYALTRTGGTKLVAGDASFGLDGHISVKQDDTGDTDVRFSSESMEEFVNILMNFIQDRQVVDQTGLQGRFDFTLTIPTAALQSVDAGEKTTAFLRGVQPLGFRLVPTNAPLQVMNVTQVRPPSPN